MEIKDNGLDLNAETEQETLLNGSPDVKGKEQAGSAVFRKFKDANALAQAYGALEAEFTRRSQRLKELERLLERESKKTLDRVEAEEKGGKTPDDSTKTAIDATECEVDVVQPDNVGDDLVVAFGGGESEKTNASVVGWQEQGFGKPLSSDGEKANESVVAPSVESVVQKLSEDELYGIVLKNDGLRKKIVGEYLASLKKAGAPLARGGVGAVASPPSKARSLSEAGNLALQFFRTAKSE
jgi:hypothetical protein